MFADGIPGFNARLIALPSTGAVVVELVSTSRIVAPFPADVQSYIVMVAGAGSAAKQSAAAREMIKFLTSPAAQPVIKAKGMERQGN